MAGLKGCLSVCCGNRFCLRIRRNQNLQRATRKLEKTPNGIRSLLPVLPSFVAWLLSISSSIVCTFVLRSVQISDNAPLDAEGAAVLVFQNHGVGFWGWESDGVCYSFNINGNAAPFDTAYRVANAMTTMTDLLGGACMVLLFLGTCFPVRPGRYLLIGITLVLVMIFEFSTLAVLSSAVCGDDFFSYATGGHSLSDFVSASCSIPVGSGASMAIGAGLLWGLAAVLVLGTNLVSRSREPRLLTPSPANGGATNGEQEPERQKHDQEREAEIQKRYEAMFGEDFDDDDDDATGDGKPREFKPYNRPLSQVKEETESEQNDISGHQQTHKSDDDGVVDYDDVVETYDDEYIEEKERKTPEKDGRYGKVYDDDDDNTAGDDVGSRTTSYRSGEDLRSAASEIV